MHGCKLFGSYPRSHKRVRVFERFVLFLSEKVYLPILEFPRGMLLD